LNDLFNLRTIIVDIGGFDSINDIDERLESGVVLELMRQLLLEPRYGECFIWGGNSREFRFLW